jgi:D-3-phosphoglycerate dehydrogenase
LINALNIPVSDPSILKKMTPYYRLTEKMGNILSQLSEGPIKDMEIICYGKAFDSKSISLVLLKSILSNIIDQRVNMVNADIVAKERNIKFSHTYKNDEIPFLSLITCILRTEIGVFEISGSVFDENRFRIVNIMGFDIDLNPVGKMLFIINKDVPGVIGNIGSLLGKHGVNIAEYLLGKIDSSDSAYGIVKLNSKINEEILNSLKSLSEIVDVKQIIIEENQ